LADKRRAAAGLQLKYSQITLRLTQEIKDAASKVAQQKNLKLVVTREGVGYGGTDITPDVETAMNITEKATPSPSP
jgi:Skp family chaperone for outer membrane proteins